MEQETVSDDLDMLVKGGANHILLVETTDSTTGEIRWQASVGKRGGKGYSVFTDKEPGIALFGAMQRAGLADGPTWQHPDPLQRLKNALDRAIIARWAASS